MSLIILAQIPTTYTAATGGSVTTDGDYKVHTFNSSGTFTVSEVGTNNTVEYLIIAGGGGSGFGGGGWWIPHCDRDDCYGDRLHRNGWRRWRGRFELPSFGVKRL